MGVQSWWNSVYRFPRCDNVECNCIYIHIYIKKSKIEKSVIKDIETKGIYIHVPVYTVKHKMEHLP